MKYWLHYDSIQNSVFCITCSTAYQQKKLINTKVEPAFVTGKGFSDWSHANKAFFKQCHSEATSKVKINKILEKLFLLIIRENRTKIMNVC